MNNTSELRVAAMLQMLVIYKLPLLRSLYCIIIYCFFKKDFMYLFLERGEGREKEGEKHPCARDTSRSYLLHTPNWGPGPHYRPMPWLGIEPVTFQFAGQSVLNPLRHTAGAIIYWFWYWSHLLRIKTELFQGRDSSIFHASFPGGVWNFCFDWMREDHTTSWDLHQVKHWNLELKCPAGEHMATGRGCLDKQQCWV